MVFFSFIQILIEHPYQTPRCFASDLGLHCLPVPHKNDTRLILVKVSIDGTDVVNFPICCG